MKLSLVPTERRFYELFRKQGQLLSETLSDLSKSMLEGRSRHPRLRDLEHQADNVTHEIYRLTNRTFVTPIDQEDILQLFEGLLLDVVPKVAPEKRILQAPFLRLTFQESMDLYGNDKPDMRWDHTIVDLTYMYTRPRDIFPRQRPQHDPRSVTATDSQSKAATDSDRRTSIRGDCRRSRSRDGIGMIKHFKLHGSFSTTSHTRPVQDPPCQPAWAATR